MLFVCTGNICRSPMAERLAVAFGESRQLADWTFSSAGTRAVIGSPIHPKAASVLERLGGDPTPFEARQLTAKTAQHADLLLTMTERHRDYLLERMPSLLRRCFTLSEASLMASGQRIESLDCLSDLRSHIPAGRRGDVVDPIGQNDEVFASVGLQIAELLDPVLQLCQRCSIE